MYACVKVSDPLELELQTVVNCHVGAGSSGRAASARNQSVSWVFFFLLRFIYFIFMCLYVNPLESFYIMCVKVPTEARQCQPP